jgi:glycosyltransferase involved in cell wall biosynthesis
MSSKPLLSIITVCYQAEKLLEETLQSAMQQTFQDFELVIIDGGSTDSTVEIARKFAAKTATLISEKDKGIYDAMNKGVMNAKGEWIYFLNAGDRFYSNTVLEQLFTKPIPKKVGLIYGKVQTINEPTGVDYVAGEAVTIKDFYNRYPINHQATFTRKSAFVQLGAYDISYKLAADTEWFVRIFTSTDFDTLFVDEIISYYDIQGASYHKRMQGYSEYLRFSSKHFPFLIVLKNYLMYPVIWLKVKLIRMLTGTKLFAWYRELKFKKPHRVY